LKGELKLKLHHVFFSIAVLLFMATSALSQDWLRSTQYRNGFRYVVRISEEDAEKLPSWNEEADEAPLSTRKAMDIARANLNRLVPNRNEKWLLRDVTLNRILRDKWIYEITFMPEEIHLGDDFMFTLFVTMDGRIVEPEITLNDGKHRIY
jgi:hypothetical protein